MIAADTSTWIAYLQGEAGDDVRLLDLALEDKRLLMPPAVLTELLSEPALSAELILKLLGIPLIEIEPGFWQRAGALRAKVIRKKRKARLGDALIAQSCLDQGAPLITRDSDFRAFADAAALELIANTFHR